MGMTFHGHVYDVQRLEQGHVNFYAGRLMWAPVDKLKEELDEKASQYVTNGLPENLVRLLKDVAAKRGLGENYVPNLFESARKHALVMNELKERGYRPRPPTF